jgi:hypothetical protein
MRSRPVLSFPVFTWRNWVNSKEALVRQPRFKRHLPNKSQSYLTLQRNKKLSSGRRLERNARRHVFVSLAQEFPRDETRHVLLRGLRPATFQNFVYTVKIILQFVQLCVHCENYTAVYAVMYTL